MKTHALGDIAIAVEGDKPGESLLQGFVALCFVPLAALKILL